MLEHDLNNCVIGGDYLLKVTLNSISKHFLGVLNEAKSCQQPLEIYINSNFEDYLRSFSERNIGAEEDDITRFYPICRSIKIEDSIYGPILMIFVNDNSKCNADPICDVLQTLIMFNTMDTSKMFYFYQTNSIYYHKNNFETCKNLENLFNRGSNEFKLTDYFLRDISGLCEKYEYDHSHGLACEMFIDSCLKGFFLEKDSKYYRILIKRYFKKQN